MKTRQIIPLLLVVTLLCGFDQPVKIIRTTTDAQIAEAQQEVLRRYKSKVVITVFNRNGKGEITNIKAQRYKPDGGRGGSCESDNFGYMVIDGGGFYIEDYKGQ